MAMKKGKRGIENNIREREREESRLSDALHLSFSALIEISGSDERVRAILLHRSKWPSNCRCPPLLLLNEKEFGDN